MTIDDLLAQLAYRGIQLSRDHGRIRYRPKTRMTPELAAVIRSQKAEIFSLPAFPSCGRWPLLVPESRAAGICLRCLPAEEYTTTIRTIGKRRRHSQEAHSSGDMAGSGKELEAAR